MREKLISDGTPSSVEVDGDVYYYKNGTVKMHNSIMGMMGDKDKRQQAFARAVHMLMVDDKGKPVFDQSSREDFQSLTSEKANHNLIRELGMKFIGLSADEDDETFDDMVDQEMGNAPAITVIGSK